MTHANTGVEIAAVGVLAPPQGVPQDALRQLLEPTAPDCGEALDGLDLPEDLPAFGCRIGDFKTSEHVESIKTYHDRASGLAIAGAREALVRAGLLDPAGREHSLGLAYATAWGCLDSMALFYGKLRTGRARSAPALPFSHSFSNSPSSMVAIAFALDGHSTTHSGGWTCGADAIVSAADAVLLGHARHMLAGGSEALSRLLLLHHDARGELSPSGHTANGDGLVLGEGAAYVVLRSAADPGTGPRLAGWSGASGSVGAPAVERAVNQAIRNAGVVPADINLVLSGACGLAELDELEHQTLRRWADREGVNAQVIAPAARFGFLSGASAPLGVSLAAEAIAGQAVLPQADPLGSGAGGEACRGVLVVSFDPGGAAMAMVVSR